MITFRKEQEPDVLTYVDENENIFMVEVALPGISKDDIKLKVSDHCLLVLADGIDVVYSKYIPFIYPVNPTKARASYEHGMLRIRVPLRA